MLNRLMPYNRIVIKTNGTVLSINVSNNINVFLLLILQCQYDSTNIL